MFQLSFHMFICAFHLEISSYFFFVRVPSLYSYFYIYPIILLHEKITHVCLACSLHKSQPLPCLHHQPPPPPELLLVHLAEEENINKYKNKRITNIFKIFSNRQFTILVSMSTSSSTSQSVIYIKSFSSTILFWW